MPGTLARQGPPAAMPGRLARQTCPALVPGSQGHVNWYILVHNGFYISVIIDFTRDFRSLVNSRFEISRAFWAMVDSRFEFSRAFHFVMIFLNFADRCKQTLRGGAL
jgi:hypothetical protein